MLYPTELREQSVLILEVFTTSVNRQKESISHNCLCEILSLSETHRSFIYYFFAADQESFSLYGITKLNQNIPEQKILILLGLIIFTAIKKYTTSNRYNNYTTK